SLRFESGHNFSRAASPCKSLSFRIGCKPGEEPAVCLGDTYYCQFLCGGARRHAEFLKHSGVECIVSARLLQNPVELCSEQAVDLRHLRNRGLTAVSYNSVAQFAE